MGSLIIFARTSCQCYIQGFNAQHWFGSSIGQAFPIGNLRFAVHRAGASCLRPIAVSRWHCNTNISSFNLQRHAKINNKDVRIVECVVQEYFLASRFICCSRASHNLDAGIITIPILRTNCRHRRQVSRNNLLLALQIRHCAIIQLTIHRISQTNVLIKDGSRLNSDIVAVEFLVGFLINVVYRQRIRSLPCAKIVGNLHRLLTINLNARNNRFSADAVSKCSRDASIGTELTSI